jgi:hypothetical protein
LEERFPERAERVLSRIRETRDGRLNDAEFGRRMIGSGALAEMIGQQFQVFAQKHGLRQPLPPLDCQAFRLPGRLYQPTLF